MVTVEKPALVEIMAMHQKDNKPLSGPSLLTHICIPWPHQLTHKQLEMHGCILSTVATDVLVLKHQAISIHSADLMSIALDPFQMNILHLHYYKIENKIKFSNNSLVVLRVNP